MSIRVQRQSRSALLTVAAPIQRPGPPYGSPRGSSKWSSAAATTSILVSVLFGFQAGKDVMRATGTGRELGAEPTLQRGLLQFIGVARFDAEAERLSAPRR